MLTVVSVLGTRPEAIKLAPVVRELAKHADRVRSVVCVTAQHREMLDQVLDLFQIVPHYDLNLMEDRQTLPQLTARLLVALEGVLTESRPDWMLVQGDTTTAMAASLMSYYLDIKLGHVEAGLRTLDKHAPFPEEINRRITSTIADLHFAPTERARQALLGENIPERAIHVTGNTVVDALHWAVDTVRKHPPRLPGTLSAAIDSKPLVLVTGHRRESFGEPFRQICLALRDLAQVRPDVAIVYPVHLNPNVRKPVYGILGDTPAVHLTEPLPYAAFVRLMTCAHVILTDSGGVQEEGASLGKPVLVMRETTERPEGITVGNACLVGTDRAQIVHHTLDLLANPDRHRTMSCVRNPYGDGRAATRIVEALLSFQPSSHRLQR